MAASTNATTGTEATVMWGTFDGEAAKKQVSEKIDESVRQWEDLSKKGLKDYLLSTLPGVLSVGIRLLEKMGVSFGSSAESDVSEKISKSLDRSIDVSVESTGQAARRGLNWSAGNSIDSTSSISQILMSYFTKA